MLKVEGFKGLKDAPAEEFRLARKNAPESTSASVTATAIGWPTARYWHMTFLFWSTTRARAR